MDQLTKSAHFLAMHMTFTLEEFYRLYIRDIVSVTWTTSLYSIGPGSQVYSSFLGELPASHRDTVDDEHHFSSPDEWSVKEDHPDVRRHATSMSP